MNSNDLDQSMPSNLIVLSDVKDKFRPGACQHMRIDVDPDLNMVKCRDCHVELNPMAIMARFCKEQSVWQWRAEQYRTAYLELKKLEQELAAKLRCKCQHCKQMTKIDRRVPTLRMVNK
jgi:hypothetical protein